MPAQANLNGQELLVNQVTTGFQDAEDAAGLVNGNAVIVWDDQTNGITFRIISPTGVAVAGQVTVEVRGLAADRIQIAALKLAESRDRFPSACTGFHDDGVFRLAETDE